ncbi:CDP-alcohol phosphatidyltransferase family protein [Pseudoduganella albidiflava]|uniref:CDP-alcohol phosphatidyltransferase n=1 Tax=Pseudoduganella albidiflava TaxID=321983 RepID=A0A411X767_9BURK|nr:CDP-alcohol phosphatidyltransferase family protein [Pseudoduganella albidiflava]QBI04708.1 CDP-alcohol phosphatidyltransferase family protein [Pseudoduganella albidiflava]GGY44073.1 CDP-alcohol phosphatidyltransferase [Pseudoduganella albidiflava]
MAFSIYQLKPRFQQLLRPLLSSLARIGVTPNQVTLAAMFLSCAYGAALAAAPDSAALWYGLPAFLLFRMALNAIDGMLATATGNKTSLGAVLNEMGDQVSDAALYLPFALAAGISAPLVVGVVVAALLAEFAGVLAQGIGVARRFDGPMGKSDRAFALGVIALLIGSGVTPAWSNGLLCVVLLLCVLTIVNRLRQALRLCVPPTR